jgi:hypothetical protein
MSNPITLRPITDRQNVVIETITMRLSTKEALVYLHEYGFRIKEATFYREKAKLEKTKLQRLYLKAKIGFVDQHLDKIIKLEFIEKEMWKKYRECKDPYKGVEILTQIANLQPIVSAYYESTRYVLERREKDFRNIDSPDRDYPTVF